MKKEKFTHPNLIHPTPTEIISLLDEMKKNGIVKYGRGDIPRTPYLDSLNKIYKPLYNTFHYSEEINEENFFEGYYVNNLFIVYASYYKVYTDLFGKEPYNLAQRIYDYLHVGYTYKLDPFRVITSKKIENNQLSVSYIPFHRIYEIVEEDEVDVWDKDDFFVLMVYPISREKTETYNLDFTNDNLMNVVSKITYSYTCPNHAKDYFSISILKENINKLKQTLELTKNAFEKIEKIETK